MGLLSPPPPCLLSAQALEGGGGELFSASPVLLFPPASFCSFQYSKNHSLGDRVPPSYAFLGVQSAVSQKCFHTWFALKVEHLTFHHPRRCTDYLRVGSQHGLGEGTQGRKPVFPLFLLGLSGPLALYLPLANLLPSGVCHGGCASAAQGCLWMCVWDCSICMCVCLGLWHLHVVCVGEGAIESVSKKRK